MNSQQSLCRATVVGLMLTIVLSGCSIEAGTAAGEHFTAWAEEHPMHGVRVEGVDANDVLPMIGNATALLHGDPGTEPRAVMDHYCAYTAAKSPVRLELRYTLATGATMSMPLDCDTGLVPDTAVYENLDGLVTVDLRSEAVVEFRNAKTLAAGLLALDETDHRTLVAVVTDPALYVRLDRGADDAVNAAAAQVAGMASTWPITQVRVTPGYDQRPDALSIVVRGTRTKPTRRAVEEATKGLDATVTVVRGPQ